MRSARVPPNGPRRTAGTHCDSIPSPSSDAESVWRLIQKIIATENACEPSMLTNCPCQSSRKSRFRRRVGRSVAHAITLGPYDGFGLQGSAFDACGTLYLPAAIEAIFPGGAKDEAVVGDSASRGLAAVALAAFRQEHHAVLRRGLPRVRRHLHDAHPGARQLGLRLLAGARQGDARGAPRGAGRRRHRGLQPRPRARPRGHLPLRRPRPPGAQGRSPARISTRSGACARSTTSAGSPSGGSPSGRSATRSSWCWRCRRSPSRR